MIANSRHDVREWLAGRLAEILDLETDALDPSEPLASYGLSSLDAASLSGEVAQRLGADVPPTLFYDYPTLAAVVDHLCGRPAPAPAPVVDPAADTEAVAVIGMACRFPGAPDVAAFWRLLAEGRSGIVDVPADRWDVDAYYDADPAAPGKTHVRSGGFLEAIDQFDHRAFGLSPREAAHTDPQQRLLLELAWLAIEDAALPFESLRGSRTGVYVGIGASDFARWQRQEPGRLDAYAGTGAASSIAANRLSYFFDLRGPSLAVDTACSSALTAVHLACQSLRHGESTLALAAAVNLILSPENTIIFGKAGMLAADGACKVFDARANGYVRSEGAGVIVLKPYRAAVAAGERIYAVIRGTTVNQDGRSNGLTAPNRHAQETLLREAYARAGISPGRVAYVEAHGAGTELGDPIEAGALNAVLGEGRAPGERCAIGSVKTNIGHAEVAAGMAGLIKTVLALGHKQIPPSLHFETPNPHIAFERTVLRVPTSLEEWPATAGPAVAGVSAFGFGGANAHVVLEEAPAAPARGAGGEEMAAPDAAPRDWQLLCLSARTPRALEAAAAALAAQIAGPDAPALADVAYALNVTRTAHDHRRFAVCCTNEDACAALHSGGLMPRGDSRAEAHGRSTVFLFPGLGDHYLQMAAGLYAAEPVFRDELDRSAEVLHPHLGVDLRRVLYPANAPTRAAGRSAGLRALVQGTRPAIGASELDRPEVAHPAILAVELALARLLQAWGVRPDAMIGFSVGEYAAATIAGVFTTEAALEIVATRARLLGALPPGGMMAVALGASEAEAILDPRLSVAVDLTPAACVVAGPADALAAFAHVLTAREVSHRRLAVSHAFHSSALDAAAAKLAALIARFSPRPPSIPYVSNLTGDWIRTEQATDPAYYARHACRPVRFEAGIRRLLEAEPRYLVEVGPGQALGSFFQQHPAFAASGPHSTFATLPHALDERDDLPLLLSTLGALWTKGAAIDWNAFHAGRRRCKVALPPYAFDRQRHWPAAPVGTLSAAPASPATDTRDPAGWFYTPSWKPAPPRSSEASPPLTCLLIDNRKESAAILAGLLRRAEHRVVVAAASGDGVFRRVSVSEYELDIADATQLTRLLRELDDSGHAPTHVVHLSGLSTPRVENAASFHAAQERGMYSVLALARVLHERGAGTGDEQHVLVATVDAYAVAPGDRVRPEHGTIQGICRVIAQEMPGLRCRHVDVASSDSDTAVAEALRIELAAVAYHEPAVAWRQGAAYVPHFDRRTLSPLSGTPGLLRERGGYLITGGTGGIGLLIAEYLARTVRARLLLTCRSPFPPREAWDTWAAEHPDDPRRHAIARLQACEAAGASVSVVSADVADEQAMRAVLEQARAAWGRVDGVIHGAGVVAADAFAGVERLTRADCERHFRPKVDGVYALRAVAGEPDFVILLSSLSAVLGGIGFAAYAAANAFMDAFAHAQQGRSTTRWLSVNLEYWLTRSGRESTIVLGPTVARYAMQPDEGVRAFAHVLSGRFDAQVAMSTGDLGARIAEWVRLESLARSRPATGRAADVAAGDVERVVTEVWAEMLGVEHLSPHDNFFDLGGNSLIGVQLIARLNRRLGVQLATVALFEAPTVARMTAYVEQRRTIAASRRVAVRATPAPAASEAIAIVGMAGRFPGARNVAELWDNLVRGIESVSFFTDEELVAAGVPAELLRTPNYVKARPVVEGAGEFDAHFFGYSPREADVTDPQLRLFLECAHEALENAACDPDRSAGAIGVFAGTNMSTYWLQMRSDPQLASALNIYQVAAGNDKDSLATTVSYKLNLRGPSVTVQTHCSTSLVAVHLACQSLRTGESDVALAGGAAIRAPQISGYLYEPGSQESPDGHTRSFDRQAKGTVFGDGVGVVVLKRLGDAAANGDVIHAVIKASAINNDGALKAGFTAPSVVGQAEAIATALARADVPVESIAYVEAHGSATELGDPIEMAALNQAFRAGTTKRHFCAVGSVKSNVGHLDKAAGVTGLIKTVLAVERGLIPPSLHFREPNPEIELDESPFYVNTELRPWPADLTPRRAGVNSLGMGGTNAHVVLEEAPAREASGPGREWQLLVLSAKTEGASVAARQELAAHLRAHAERPLADVAYTLQVGRRVLPQRTALVCRDTAEAAAVLASGDPARLLTAWSETRQRPVRWLFAGVGDHYVGMGAGLYRTERVFRDAVDRCAAAAQQYLDGRDLRAALWPRGVDTGGGVDLRGWLRGARAAGLDEPRLAQTAVFTIGYALAQLATAWGLRPEAVIGYSLGEYTAACVAGVFTPEDAVALVAQRAALIETMPAGAMLAVSAGAATVAPQLPADTSIAIVTGPAMCVVAGPLAAIAALETTLTRAAIVHRRVQTTRALHGPAMAGAAAALERLMAAMPRQAPTIPVVSTVTGTWLTEAEATSPAYWARHLCATVDFAAGLETLLRGGEAALVDLGPGQTLTSLVKQAPVGAARVVVPLLRAPYEAQDDQAVALTALGKLWLSGVAPDWAGVHQDERRRRVSLPTYPFERQRYWLEPRAANAGQLAPAAASPWRLPASDWLHRVAWSPRPLPPSSADARSVLVFLDAGDLGRTLAHTLEREGHHVTMVSAGDAFAERGANHYEIDPANAADYSRLLGAPGTRPRTIVHLGAICGLPDAALRPDACDASQLRGFHSLVRLAQALGDRQGEPPTHIVAVTANARQVADEPVRHPEQATVLGPCRTIPAEYTHVTCRAVDVDLASGDALDVIAAQLAREVCDESSVDDVAYRGGERFVAGVTRLADPARGGETTVLSLREDGVYVITGGFGGIGLSIAERLARDFKARLVLVGRQAAGDDNRRVQAVRNLERLGAQVLTLAADVANPAQMQTAIAAALERFGRIDGVFHAAGVPGGGLMQFKTPEMADAVLAPKVRGTLALAHALRAHPPEFVALFSSIAAVVGGGPGQVDYCAANAFLNAFASFQSARGTPTIAVAWCEWEWDAWQERLLAFSPELQEHFRSNRKTFGLTFDEGFHVLGRALASGRSELVVSTRDVDAVITEARALTTASILKRFAPAPPAAHGRPAMATAYVPASDEIQRTIAAAWERVLGIERVGVNDNFFDLGGNSLIGLQIISELSRALERPISPVLLYEAPTVQAMAQLLNPPAAAPAVDGAVVPAVRPRKRRDDAPIAIVGMAGRFPGARDVDAFWRNLADGVESITFLSDEELRAAGVEEGLLADPLYVKAASVLDDIDCFDAGLFGYSPREAEVMDPQHRLFLECAWAALEDAGCDPDRYPGAIGVFGGASISTYLLRLHPDKATFEPYNLMQIGVGYNSSDSLTTKVSYKLNLSGPSVALQTFCSTSGIAIHMACKTLKDGECDMALAGGVRVAVPHRAGYKWMPGSIDSPDGHCRAFDAKGQGVVLGNGVAIVALKRLEDALADGSHIYAVIKGSAANNDGALKVGYTAPSVDRQAQVVTAALADADVTPDQVSYIEAHGTGTELGDPIEVAALTRAFRAGTDGRQFCAIGTVKTNVGHLDRAAGATSIIKTALALERQMIPASLHFEEPNPQIDYANSPFYVNTALTPWPRHGSPRTAGVHVVGIGGTNIHFVLQEAPAREASGPGREWQLLVLSAKTEGASVAARQRLAAHLRAHAERPLADVAYTLQVGRRVLPQRTAVVCRDVTEAVAALESADPTRVLSAWSETRQRPVRFLFAGVGDHYVGMGAGLYRTERVFREAVDRCVAAARPHLDGRDLRAALWPAGVDAVAAGGVDLRAWLRGDRPAGLDEPRLAQTAVFTIGYALAQLAQAWGLRPEAVVGYSLGEYTAACVAGVFTPEDAVALVAQRAALIETMPAGAMLAVSASAAALAPRLVPDTAIAIVNGPAMCVVSGTPEAIAALETALSGAEIGHRRVLTARALHGPQMAGAAAALERLIAAVPRQPPAIPIVSNLTGTWMTAADATSPACWARHLCEPVRFEAGLDTLLGGGDAALVDLGPGQTLTSLVRQAPAGAARVVVPFLRAHYDKHDDQAVALTALGKLWLSGVAPDWAGVHQDERRHRVSLPTYPFERQRYWLEPRAAAVDMGALQPTEALGRIENIADWFYVPVWKQSVPFTAEGVDRERRTWLVFTDDGPTARGVIAGLEAGGERVLAVHAADRFARLGETALAVDVRSRADYARLLKAAAATSGYHIVHCWTLSGTGSADPQAAVDATLTRGVYPLMYLAQALGDAGARARITVVSTGIQRVTGDEVFRPEHALLVGPCKVIPQEYADVRCSLVDVVPTSAGAGRGRDLARDLVDELRRADVAPSVAWRGGQRWVEAYDPLPLAPSGVPARLRERGVYVITGGTGGIGFALAKHLARTVGARLVLIGRVALPPRENWDDYLSAAAEGDGLARKIRDLRDLESLGAEVMVESANVADAAALGALVERVEARFGAVHGVVHCAGVPGAGLIQLKTPEAVAGVLKPKVDGTIALARAFAGRPLDFMVLFSSLTSIVGGGPGQFEYCAANAFLDAFARAEQARGRCAIAIDWGEWRWDAWQQGLLGFDENIQAFFRKNRETYGVTFEEGMDAFDRIVNAGTAQVVVSTRQFSTFARLSTDFTLSAIVKASASTAASEAPLHERPVLGTSYVAPTTERERQIASIWRGVLRIEQIGVHDNFFDLGGNSLVGIELIARMRAELGAELPMYALYEAASVAEMAKFLDAVSPAADAAEDGRARGSRRRARRERRAEREGAAVPVPQ